MSRKIEKPPETIAGVDRACFDTWLAASCERQGVPVIITDLGIVHQIVVLLGRRTKTSKYPQQRSLTQIAQLAA
ncbi:MAG: hypothetical protein ACRC20_06275 [Segniliparus sp.]|uniref:hypothetical protein n=1 Tax=Segniliparus sp. TaxID=2804064 RepID=UPI003F39B204